MFPGTGSEYTHLQNSLLFWCRYYYNILKNLGFPEDANVIEDDAAFDKWVKKKVDELHNPKNKKNENSSTGVQKYKIVFNKPICAG